MVLYTNDAVEVRYSDGSQLQLSPCGASMFHQDAQRDDCHPLESVGRVQKWTQFVTSAHKTKVLQALDFRNRFAYRPFLCPSLLAAEDIVSLYARIDRVAWPKSHKDALVVLMEDGSKRISSYNEFASMILSPHEQDFTLCYLSRISEDTNKVKEKVLDGKSKLEVTEISFDNDFLDPDLSTTDLDNIQNESGCNIGSGIRSEQNSSLLNHNTNNELLLNNSQNTQSHNVEVGKLFSEQRESVNCNKSCDSPVNDNEIQAHNARENVSQSSLSTPNTNFIHKICLPSEEDETLLPKYDISAIQHDISSISRISTPDGLRGMIDTDTTLTNEMCVLTQEDCSRHRGDFLHSSPLNLANTQSKSSKLNCDVMNVKETVLQCDAVASHFITPNENETAKEEITSHLERCNYSDLGAKNSLAEEKINQGTESELMIKNTGCQNYSPTANKGCQTLLPATVVPPCLSSPVLTHPNSAATSQGVQLGPNSLNGKTLSKVKSSKLNCHKTLHQRYTAAKHFSTSEDLSHIRSQNSNNKAYSAKQEHYTWVTQHMSCNDCPATWRHPLKLLQQAEHLESVTAITSGCHLESSLNEVHHLLKATELDSKKYCFSPLVPPLPLTCPFQHQHAWQPHHNDREERGRNHISEFKQGQLKIIMMEGVIYRFIHLPNMKIVEVYPGDGSVFVSQGVTGHFFLHIVWKEGKLEEKTYSLKALPPNTPRSAYSIEKLLKRAHRFLTGCIENSKLSEREDLPCWRQAPLQVVEPLPSSVLEECIVPGFGRFMAYTNGRVRIIFEDRTALDIMSDFSQQFLGCLQQSDNFDNQKTAGKKLAPMTALHKLSQSGQCRLLLPSGKYVMVDINKPGIYRRYINAATEWIGWVRSSPKDRRQHNQNKNSIVNAQMYAEAELKKIKCFNYIVDPSQIPTSFHLPDLPSNHNLPYHQLQAIPNPFCISNPCTDMAQHHKASIISKTDAHCHGTTQYGQIYSTGSYAIETPFAKIPMAGVDGDFTKMLKPMAELDAVPASVVNPHRPQLPLDSKGLELMQGFNSVREALIRTSQMIKEIDEIVKDRNVCS